MSCIEVNMPQMAVVGLSENWVFRHSGNEHWSALCKSLGTRSSELFDSNDRRLYSSFLAVSIRARPSLARFEENDTLVESRHLERFGTSIYRSVAELRGTRGAVGIEMLSKFVSREHDGSNRLRSSSLRPTVKATAPDLANEPNLLESHRQVRATAPRYVLENIEVSAFASECARIPYVPNPYIEYNGAGLLYFASYPTICDGVERQYFTECAPVALKGDWALTTSTVARDVFYFGNLDLGDVVTGKIRRPQIMRDPEGHLCHFVTHTSLLEAKTDRVLAEIFTMKKVL